MAEKSNLRSGLPCFCLRPCVVIVLHTFRWSCTFCHGAVLRHIERTLWCCRILQYSRKSKGSVEAIKVRRGGESRSCNRGAWTFTCLHVIPACGRRNPVTARTKIIKFVPGSVVFFLLDSQPHSAFSPTTLANGCQNTGKLERWRSLSHQPSVPGTQVLKTSNPVQVEANTA